MLHVGSAVLLSNDFSVDNWLAEYVLWITCLTYPQNMPKICASVAETQRFCGFLRPYSGKNRENCRKQAEIA
jgi:hypothetical protein